MHSILTRSILRRSAAAILAGALIVSTVGLTPAQARHWHHGNAAALGAVMGMFGTIAAIAAADQYRHRYYDGDPYYYDAPYGYGGPYVYSYGGYGGYGGGHGYHGYHGHHHHHH
jgi:hypothetical protein